MMRDSQGLTPAQRRFVEAMVGSPSVVAACRLAGCSEGSGRRWLRDVRVQAALDVERRRILDAIADGVRAHLEAAFGALGALLACDNEQVRCSAALGLLNAGLRVGGAYAREKSAGAGPGLELLGFWEGVWEGYKESL